jgi:predicted alpha/beta hydrolase family esterase
VWHSLWTRVSTGYIIKNNIKLERLILVSPCITAKRKDWTDRHELIDFFSDYKIWELDSRFDKLKKLVNEIIVIASLDDTAVPFEESKQFAEIIWAKFIEVDWYGHFNDSEYEILNKLVQFGDIK